MNMTNIVAILILVVIIAWAVKGTVSHFKGEGACCGGGASEVKTKPRKLDSVKSVKIMTIKGMHCEHCYTRVHNALNSIEGVSANVQGKRGRAVIKTDRDIDNEVLKKVVTDLGYEAEEITVK